MNFTSDARKMFSYSLASTYGSYYNGSRLSFDGSLNYRIQPYVNFAITSNYNNISLPYPYKSNQLILIGNRIDLTFTDKLFLTTYVQYNKQIDNINMNVRFQWRFAPASDLFVIYTENSYAGDFVNKNKGIALKISYWLN